MTPKNNPRSSKTPGVPVQSSHGSILVLRHCLGAHSRPQLPAIPFPPRAPSWQQGCPHSSTPEPSPLQNPAAIWLWEFRFWNTLSRTHQKFTLGVAGPRTPGAITCKKKQNRAIRRFRCFLQPSPAVTTVPLSSLNCSKIKDVFNYTRTCAFASGEMCPKPD